ncbi:polymer-forming cytoskeletal protein [Desulfobacter vibrioformis]|uniref:polymer-forming cytoskeletal protein n=1 Tax=Desulfobacter vibrioformis TaxID=34031 RepID=UPI00069102FB|nr:polymer-forming cytoskeletal protein [Desulfobacter vibrioformis]
MIINNLKNETGSSLLFIIISIVVLGVLGAGMFSLFTSSTISVFTPNYSLKARYMAEAGIRYAKGKIRSADDQATAVNELTDNGGGLDYALEDENGFSLDITQGTSSYTITSTGFSGTGTARSYIKLSDSTLPLPGNSGADPWTIDSANVLYGGAGMSISGSAKVEGSISTANDFSINGSGKLKGDVNAGGNVTVEGAGTVEGNIVSGGAVEVKGGKGDGTADVTGNIDAQGDVILTGNVIVAGNITTTGNVVISGSCKVIGTINAGGSVTIEGTGSVGGDIIAGGNVTITSSGTANGNVDSGGDISVGWGGSIKGNATAAGSVSSKEADDIEGSILENAASPPLLVPEDPEEYYESTLQLPDTPFTAGETDICGTGTPLAPGKYGVLKTKYACKDIYLSPGQYYFKEIDASWNTKLYLDLSEATEEEGIEIFVVGDAVFQSSFEVWVSTDGINYQLSTAVDKSLSAHIYLETMGNFNMGSVGQWFGAVYAWEELTVSSGNSSYIGSFYLRDLNNLTIGSDVKVVLVPSNYIKNNWYEE